MSNAIKPIIVVSKCLGFEKCRYNGGIENNEFINKLMKYVDIITVCPEVECGLSVPRDPLRIVEVDNKLELIQPKTNNILTEKMLKFCDEYLDNSLKVDGFILKCKSPSCGIKDAKIYNSVEKGSLVRKSKGFFAMKIDKKFPYIPCEDEGRLTNFKIREHFLTRIFIVANFRIAKESLDYEALKLFHLNNTLLFLSYNQKYSKILDTLILGEEIDDVEKLFNNYEFNLNRLLDRAPRYTSNITVLLKAIEQFRDKITDEEMQFIWNTIDKYKKAYVPFSVPLYLVKGYVVRFELENLINQSFFMPYPEDLILVNDSGKLIH